MGPGRGRRSRAALPQDSWAGGDPLCPPRTVRRWTPGNPVLLVVALSVLAFIVLALLFLGPPTRFGPAGW